MLTQEFARTRSKFMQLVKDRELGNALLSGTAFDIELAVGNGAELNGFFESSARVNTVEESFLEVAVKQASIENVIALVECKEIDFKKSSNSVVEDYIARPERSDDFKYALKRMAEKGADINVVKFDEVQGCTNTLLDRIEYKAKTSADAKVKLDAEKMACILKFYGAKSINELKTEVKAPVMKV